MKVVLMVATALAVAPAAFGQPTTVEESGLTEAMIAPCNHLLSYRSQFYPQSYNKERTDLSNLEFAVTRPPYTPLYDLEDTEYFLESVGEILAALEARDENLMQSRIGKIYRGAEYDHRLVGDRRFRCMLKVRYAQLTGKKPDFSDLPPPPATPLPIYTDPLTAQLQPAQLQPAQPQTAQSASTYATTGSSSAPVTIVIPEGGTTAPITIVIPGATGNTNIDALSAGQLFALADELDEQGKTAEARAARRKLIATFPDSPLAATAAQQLAATPR